VRQQIVRTIQQAMANTVKTVSEEIAKEATRTVEYTVRQLQMSVDSAQRTLQGYQREVITTQWKVVGVSIFTTIVSCVLIFWLLLPKPTLPLTNEQVHHLASGMALDRIWPKLSKKEQNHFIELEGEHHHQTESDEGQ